MRTFILFLIILLLPFLGWYSTSKYSIFESNEIAHIDDWQSILNGKWEFKVQYDEKGNSRNIKGIIKINQLAYVLRATVTCNSSSIHDSYGAFVFGGAVKGLIDIKTDSTLKLVDTSCNISLSKQGISDMCDACSLLHNLVLGNFETDNISGNIVYFTRNKIKFKRLLWSTGEYETYTLKRLE